MMLQYLYDLQAQLQASRASLEARGGGLSALCRLSSPASSVGAADERVRTVPNGQDGLAVVAAVIAAVLAAASGALSAAWTALAAGCWRLLELGGALYLSMRYFTGVRRLCHLLRCKCLAPALGCCVWFSAIGRTHARELITSA